VLLKISLETNLAPIPRGPGNVTEVAGHIALT
jgi:hypothetical protein